MQRSNPLAESPSSKGDLMQGRDLLNCKGCRWFSCVLSLLDTLPDAFQSSGAIINFSGGYSDLPTRSSRFEDRSRRQVARGNREVGLPEVKSLAVGSLENSAIPVRNTLHYAGSSLNVETARCQDRHTSKMYPGFLAFRHIGNDYVPGLETMHKFLGFGRSPKKTKPDHGKKKGQRWLDWISSSALKPLLVVCGWRRLIGSASKNLQCLGVVIEQDQGAANGAA